MTSLYFKRSFDIYLFIQKAKLQNKLLRFYLNGIGAVSLISIYLH